MRSKFRKISACSLDKENFLKEIVKVSHVLNSNFNLMSDNLTEDSVPTTILPPPPPLWF